MRNVMNCGIRACLVFNVAEVACNYSCIYAKYTVRYKRYGCRELIPAKSKHYYSVQRFQASNQVPFTMKLSVAQTESVITEDTKFLYELFKKQGYEIRIAGGAVRDILQGICPQDVDFATDATPEAMKEFLTENKLRLINPRGESHGTVTVRMNDKNFEITTLRIDKKTDGRFAEVEFIRNWYLDACRRDLTVNAMYLDFDGTVYDYFNGYEDLMKRRVVFVGDPRERICEDYLRILRYFRFYGKIAKEPDSHDVETISALKKYAEGLLKVSGERIQSELFKIISGNHGVELLKKIVDLDIHQYIGLPKCCNVGELNMVAERLIREESVPHPMIILTSLLNDFTDVENFNSRIKLSAHYRDLAFFIVYYRNRNTREGIRYYQKIVLLSKKVEFVSSAVKAYLKYIGDFELLKEFEAWKLTSLPLSGYDLLHSSGKGKFKDSYKIGYIRNKLISLWVDSNFSLTREELLKLVPEIEEGYAPRKKGQEKSKEEEIRSRW